MANLALAACRAAPSDLARALSFAAGLALVAVSGVASAQSAPRVAVLPVVDQSGSLTAVDVQGLTSSLRGSVQSAVAAEAESDSLRYVAEGVARTTISGAVGSRTVSVQIVLYATGETRQGAASELEGAGYADATHAKLRSAMAIAFRRATAGLSLAVADLAVPVAAPPPDMVQTTAGHGGAAAFRRHHRKSVYRAASPPPPPSVEDRTAAPVRGARASRRGSRACCRSG
ncbi:MAG: hypothetical protein U0441_29790 [Polyangiaceae bacterium]